THASGDPRFTLLGVLDNTSTPMGARALRRWLHRPLRDRAMLRARQQAIAALIESRAFEALREHLRAIGDLERILARVALRSARPRDLATLRDGLLAAPGIINAIVPDREDQKAATELSAMDGGFGRTSRKAHALLDILADRIGEHAATARMLSAAITERPPLLLRDG